MKLESGIHESYEMYSTVQYCTVCDLPIETTVYIILNTYHTVKINMSLLLLKELVGLDM